MKTVYPSDELPRLEAQAIAELTEAVWLKARAEQEALEISHWLAGEDVTVYSNSCYLRLVEHDDGRRVETSKGILLPFEAARLAWRFCFAKRAEGWHRNGETFWVKDCSGSDWRLDAVNEFGAIAGCHRFSWAELERFARIVGWL